MTTGVSVARAVLADATEIAELHIRTRRATYSGLLPERIVADSVERRVAQWAQRICGRVVYTARRSRLLVGFACAGPMPEHPQGRDSLSGYDAYLDALYVAPEAHGAGVGAALLAAIARTLEGSNHSLALHVLATNPAVRFYERLGAKRVRAEQIRDGDDTWVQYAYGWPELRALLAVLEAR